MARARPGQAGRPGCRRPFTRPPLTPLLPGEDPAQLTGPDAMAIQRLLHADLPVGATR